MIFQSQILWGPISDTDPQEQGMPNMGFESLTSQGRPPCLCHPFCLWVTARCFSNCCFFLGSRGAIPCSIWEGNLHFLQHFVTSGHQPCWFSKPDVLGVQFSSADPRARVLHVGHQSLLWERSLWWDPSLCVSQHWGCLPLPLSCSSFL